MPRLTTGRLRDRQAFNQVMIYTSRAPAVAYGSPAVMLRALRATLKMSQADLSRRSGISQPHIARLESGRLDAQLGTWTKLFDAMFCDLLILPKARKRPGDALADQRTKKGWGNPWNQEQK